MNETPKIACVSIPQDTTTSLADDLRVRCNAQSYLTRNGVIPNLPTLEEAREILARAEKDARK
jgi:hypothetical protein